MQEWLLAQDGAVVYASLALLLMGGVFGLPIPEDIPLILGGILIQIGKCSPLLVFVTCYVAVVTGDLIIFGFGRYFGPKVFKLRWFNTRKSKTKLKRVRVELSRKGIVMIFVARHLFYLRTVTFLSCGAVKMSFYRFLVADAIAAGISVPLMLGIGYFAANSYEHVMRILDEAKFASLFVVIILVIGYLVYKRRTSVSEDDVSSSA